jgi:zinc protease
MSKRAILFIASLFLCIGITITGAEKKKEYKIPYEKYKLANGLNVILHIDRSDPIASVYVRYHVGSNRETKGRTGFAHLFEHLMFNESQHIPQGEYFKRIQTAGGTLNGSTNNDGTNYFETVPKNALEMALWMESDRMGFLMPKVTEKTFLTQVNVVSNEKRQNYDNRAYGNAGYVLDKLMYPENHPYNWQVIGSLEDLANATLQDVLNFHDKYYLPANATLVVAGDIDVAQTKKWIEKYFGEIKSGPKPPELPKMPVTLEETKKAYYEDNLATQANFEMVFPTVEQYNKDAYALRYLGQLLASGQKSPLYKVIVEEKKIASQIQAYNGSQEIAGSFSFSGTPFAGKNMGELEDAIKEGFARFEKDGFTDKDLERLKTGIEVQFYNSIQSTLGKCMRLGDLNTYAGSPDFLDKDMKASLAVTKDDIWRVYNKYIKGKNYVALSVVPKGKADLAAPGSKLFTIAEENTKNQTVKKDVAPLNIPPVPSKFDRTVAPKSGADPVVKLPQIWQGKTVNNIKVLGINRKEVPLVQFSIILKGGSLLDPAGKTGTAYFMASLMNEGTKTKTPIELREALQDLGANINIYAGSEAISISGNCLVSKFPEVVKLAKEMMFEPRWDEKEFATIKRRTAQTLKRYESSPASIASDVFGKLVYGPENTLAQSTMGTVKTIENITIDDLKNFYNNYFVANKAAITVVGDITKEKAIPLFNALKEWKTKDFTVTVKDDESAKPGIYFIDVPNAKQSEFRVGHVSLASTNPDYYKTIVMNHKLGGDFNGILNQILREQKGFTYGARSNFSGSNYKGMFTASSAIQTSATFETAQIIKNEIDKYRQNISAENLQQVKSTLIKGNALRFETLQSLNSMLYPIVSYNYPFDYIKKQQQFLSGLTADEHTKLAQKYLQPDKMIYLIVGDKATQFDKLKELGLGNPVLIDKDGKPVNK